MRPPEHWHLRRRPQRRPWPLIALLASAVLTVAFVTLWCRSDGGGPTKASVSAPVCSVALDCTPTIPSPSYGSDSPPPAVRGLAATVIEASCGTPLLYAKNAGAQLPPASLTKMMTALIAVQREDLSRVVDVKVNGALMVASTGASIMGLEPGMRLSLLDLMYGMLLPSGNDAAVEIALDVGGTEAGFVDLMNREALRLGLRGTHFSNPAGLDQAGLYTTARDMALLGRAYMQMPELATIARTKSYQPDWDRGEVLNGNELLERYPAAIGVKTGYTELAGQTIVAAAERNGRSLIVSILGSYDRYADAIALFDWAFTSTRPACGSEPIP